ncbi:MAG: hypothetical protein O3C60_13960 [Planctomycetota bacterium]|nr:hypothetical protein [Planctomycetota bacterium]
MWGRLALLALCGSSFSTAGDLLAQPVIKSVFPSAAQQGSTISVEFRGTNLDGVISLWTDSAGVEGDVKSAESLGEPATQLSQPTESDTKSPQPAEPVVMQLRIDATARLGTHRIHLVSPSGLSNAISFFIADQPVGVEAAETHQTPTEALPTQVPALINGRLEKSGQLDYYSLMASEGDVLKFEVIQKQNLKPRLSLFGPSSSWFDAERLERHLFLEERQSDLVPTEARGTFRVQRAGRYVIQVSSLFGQASPDASYLLAISRGDNAPPRVPLPTREWTERSFTREIGNSWLDSVQTRSCKIRDLGPVRHVIESTSATTPPDDGSPETVVATQNTTATVAEVGECNLESGIALPAILEGTIGKAADIDRYRFSVQAGDEIAIEIETPVALLPAFNPWVAILDSENREVVSNLHRKVSLFNNNAERQIYIADVMPKMVHRFEKPGEYTLQVQDITAQYGDATYGYRILVRPQVPHVGEISLGGVEFLNLERGRAGRVTLTTSYEEGLPGNVTFSFSGLPEGVQALPADTQIDRKAPTQVTDNPQTVLAPTSETTLVLAVSSDAPLTNRPQIVRVECRILDQQNLGPPLLVRELPVMVVPHRENKP